MSKFFSDFKVGEKSRIAVIIQVNSHSEIHQKTQEHSSSETQEYEAFYQESATFGVESFEIEKEFEKELHVDHNLQARLKALQLNKSALRFPNSAIYQGQKSYKKDSIWPAQKVRINTAIKTLKASIISKYNAFVEKYFPQLASSRKNKRIINTGKLKNIFTSVFILTITGLSVLFLLLSAGHLNPNNNKVAGVSEKIEVDAASGFDLWSSKYYGYMVDQHSDDNQNGLTAIEEMNLGINPKEVNKCNNLKDIEALKQLINPVDCKSFDINNGDTQKVYESALENTELKKAIFSHIAIPTATEKQPDNQNLLTFFGVKSYAEIDLIDPNTLQGPDNLVNAKKDYLKTIKRINDYINAYRSYDTLDAQYNSPSHAAAYLDTSIRYNVNLKYVLTIARLESRFGTDKFNTAGYETRGSLHKNIFSIGLDDSGNNISYNSWDDGVLAFGRWYKKFADKGFTDCQKWRAYNPNGDYCSKVEGIAKETDVFLKEKSN